MIRPELTIENLTEDVERIRKETRVGRCITDKNGKQHFKPIKKISYQPPLWLIESLKYFNRKQIAETFRTHRTKN